MNAGSLLHGASLVQISGGGLNSCGDYNRTTNIHHINSHNGSTVPAPTLMTPQLSNEQDEQCTEESSNAIYERQMLLKKHGFPLWIPQPNILASPTHREKGVTIGDVGRVTPYGAFNVLFNICKPAGPPDNPDELPDGFEPLVLKANDIHQFQEYTSGCYIASASVNKLSGLTFRCSSSEGAVLTLPDGAFREDIQNITLFRDFAAENAESWYRFVNGPCGWDVGNGELRLITGCDKTTSWGLASYHNSQSRNNSSGDFGEPLLSFRSMSNVDSDRVRRATYCWEHEGMAEVKAGPECVVGEEMLDNGTRAWNQCTFIRSHTIALSEATWAGVQSTLVSSLDTRRTLKPAQPKSKSYLNFNFLTNAFSSLGMFSTRRSSTGSAKMTDLRIRSPVIHPSTFIAKMLLQEHPDAKVAIVHDDHWGAVIREDKDRMPTSLELWKRIQETFDTVLNCNGTIYLSERSTPPQQAETAHAPWGHHQMATNIVEIQNMEHLDGLIGVTAKYPIACGNYADIYSGLWAMPGRNVAVAIKVFRDAHLKTQTNEDQRKYLKFLNEEYRVWAVLRHPNVLPLFGLIDDPAIPSTGIVTPRCSLGDLRAFFSDPGNASVNRLAIVKGIASGLTYAHKKNVVHGELGMDNVVVEVINGTFTPLLSDFGRARILEQAGYTSNSAVHRHMPPEILTVEDNNRSRKAFTQAADVWCFGMVMLETLTGRIPFWYMNELEAATAVAYRNERPDQNRYAHFPHENSCWQIMGRCWDREPSDREEMPRLLQSLNSLMPSV